MFYQERYKNYRLLRKVIDFTIIHLKCNDCWKMGKWQVSISNGNAYMYF